MNEDALKVVEDEQTGDRFLVYERPDGPALDISFRDETLWMTQEQIAGLFGVTRQAVNAHLNAIYSEGELERDPTCKEILQVRREGAREVSRQVLIHNLDAIISVGYRVSSRQATLFRRWATSVLVQYAKKGFVIDRKRLKSDTNADRIAELKEIIRDIRADEANVYRELKAICALCQDYDPKSRRAVTFYQQTQAKLVYAVVGMTPSEIVVERANHAVEAMGITTLRPDEVRKKDVATSKNYLAEREMRELNRLTTILLDIFEDQADLGRLVLMADAENLLDGQLSQLGRTVLRHGGAVSAEDARRHAEHEYARFDAARRTLRHDQADREIAELAKLARQLPKDRRR